jgi:RNA polymerase sigma factor (sigma-70 family)
MGPPHEEAWLRPGDLDVRSFELFYRRHSPAVFRYLLWRVREVEVAADLTAEVFAAALQSRRRYRSGPEPARAWLFGIVNHKLAESRRHGAVVARARRKLGMAKLTYEDDELLRAEERADVASIAGSLSLLVDDLPASERAAVLARVVQERDYREIADAMGTTPAAIRQRVSRGLTRLGLGLKEH